MGSSATEAPLSTSGEFSTTRGSTDGRPQAEAILYDHFKLPKYGMGDTEIGQESVKHLIVEGSEGMVRRSDDGSVRWGNTTGLNTLDRLDRLEQIVGEHGKTIKNQGTKVQDQGKTIKNQGTKLQDQGARITSLEADSEVAQAEIKQLKASADGYLRVRNRFVTNFVKNKHPGEEGPDDEGVVDKGDQDAHHGDVDRDAELWKQNIRVDVNPFKWLYGNSPEQFYNHLSFDDQDTLEIKKALTRYGTMAADTRDYTPGDAFSNAFTAFVGALQSGNFNTANISIDGTPEDIALKAYWAQWRAIPTKIKKGSKGGKK